MRLIDADKRINLQLYDDMNEEWSVESMTIAECLDRYTEEGCPSADRPQEWIPCSERLPTKEGHYLGSFNEPHYIDNICVGLAYWTGSKWHGKVANEINAWMPLPEPWKGVDE